MVHHNTLSGGYETALHLTGLYPHWWEGKRFDSPIDAVAASDTAKATREIIQSLLFGLKDRIGSGMIPKANIVRTTPKHGLADAFDTAYIRHTPTGGTSTLVLKSYDQGVDAFKGTAVHVEWLDEEPPRVVKTEAVVRTMTTKGVVIVTTMPLQGRTDMIDDFMKKCVNLKDLPIQ